MADLMTMIRKALGLPPTTQTGHNAEHAQIDRRLASHARRLKALDERIDAQRSDQK